MWPVADVHAPLKTQALLTHSLCLVYEERQKIIKEEGSKEEDRQGVEVKQCEGSQVPITASRTWTTTIEFPLLPQLKILQIWKIGLKLIFSPSLVAVKSKQHVYHTANRTNT